MLDKVDGSSSKVGVPAKSSGATKRKFEPGQASTTGPQDAKIRKIDQATNTIPSNGTTATSSGANTKAKNVNNNASASTTVPVVVDLTEEDVSTETGKDSTDETDEWICASCTFRNHPALESCEVCSTSRYAFEMMKLQLAEMKHHTNLILPPSHWLRVDPGTRVKTVKLAENDKSYLEVSKMMTTCCNSSHCWATFVFPFTASTSSSVSIPSKFLCRIIKIERIENLHLYQMYSIKKSQMDEENGSAVGNERMLWHGTAPECVSNIASYGFNRSRCGKNGTKLGKGVYFSTVPCYSADKRYARPNPYGLQHMFCCRVLTGRYTVGDETMVEPPLLGNNLGRFNSLVDSTQNPDMFVIFHDAQAYPEFLITFTCK